MIVLGDLLAAPSASFETGSNDLGITAPHIKPVAL
jgi:hypothetical protein